MGRISLIRGDITQLNVEAIVNAANAKLAGGGGVDGAIHFAGGPDILKECSKIIETIGHLPTGEAVITTAGNMPATYVIHTVGPIWNSIDKENMKRLLASAYRNSMELAYQQGIKELAFPNISTGAYGYPKELAAKVAVTTVCEALEVFDTIQNVYFVCFDNENTDLYAEALQSL